MTPPSLRNTTVSENDAFVVAVDVLKTVSTKKGFISVALQSSTKSIGLFILNQGQVTRTTPELAPHSSNFHTSPIGGRWNLLRFNGHRPSLHGGSSMVPGLELVTRWRQKCNAKAIQEEWALSRSTSGPPRRFRVTAFT
ncbi:hypothetical protein TNCV_2262601 [Trichonephila clavipes]|nr:hypothetical protein TNCV_2262601 [Trichonephila clavipes]